MYHKMVAVIPEIDDFEMIEEMNSKKNVAKSDTKLESGDRKNVGEMIKKIFDEVDHAEHVTANYNQLGIIDYKRFARLYDQFEKLISDCEDLTKTYDYHQIVVVSACYVVSRDVKTSVSQKDNMMCSILRKWMECNDVESIDRISMENMAPLIFHKVNHIIIEKHDMKKCFSCAIL